MLPKANRERHRPGTHPAQVLSLTHVYTTQANPRRGMTREKPPKLWTLETTVSGKPERFAHGTVAVSSSRNLSDQDGHELPDEFQNLANNTVSHYCLQRWK